MGTPLVNLYTRVEPKLFRDLSKAAVRDEKTIQSIVDEALNLWLSRRATKKGEKR